MVVPGLGLEGNQVTVQQILRHLLEDGADIGGFADLERRSASRLRDVGQLRQQFWLQQRFAFRDGVNRNSAPPRALDGDVGGQQARIVVPVGEYDDHLFAAARRQVVIYPHQRVVERGNTCRVRLEDRAFGGCFIGSKRLQLRNRVVEAINRHGIGVTQFVDQREGGVLQRRKCP